MSNNIPRNLPLYSFALFLIVCLTRFINKPDSSSYLTIFIISLISSFKNINMALREAKSKGQPDPNIFLWIPASVADAAAVKGNPVFSSGTKSLPKNPLIVQFMQLSFW